MTLVESIGGLVGPRLGKPRLLRRRERRAWPIHGYCGSNGSGKTAAMVWDTLPSLEEGRQVLSTVRLLDYEDPRPCEGWRVGPAGEAVDCELCVARRVDGVAWTIGATPCDAQAGGGEARRARRRPAPHGVVELSGSGAEVDERRVSTGVDSLVDELRHSHMQAHPLWVPFTDWEQLLEARGLDVLMDEVTGVASSRESHSMPAPVANALVQMRRQDVVIRWSAPNWARADKIIRETSQAVTHATGSWPVRSEDGTRSWRQRRLFRWLTYDADEFENFTVGKREALTPITRDRFWGPGSPVFDAYDTFDAVLSIGTVSDSGRCYRCGGRRRVPECSCAPRPARPSSSTTRGQRGLTVTPARSSTAVDRQPATGATVT